MRLLRLVLILLVLLVLGSSFSGQQVLAGNELAITPTLTEQEVMSDLNDRIPDNDRALVLMCLYADTEGEPPFQIADIEYLLNGTDDPASDYQIGMKTALSLSTHGTAAITEVVYMDWKRMETDYLDYRYEYQGPDGTTEVWDTYALRTDCVNAHGYTQPPEQEYIFSFVPKIERPAYGGAVGFSSESGEEYYRRSVLSETLRPGVMLHELGHAHTLPHVLNHRGEAYKSNISSVGKTDIVGFTTFEIWDIKRQDEQFKADRILELKRPKPDIKQEVAINLHQLHPFPDESLPEDVYYAIVVELDPDRPLMGNVDPQEALPHEYLWVEYRCADQRYVKGMLNVDWFSRVRCGIRVYIEQNYRPETDDYHILWSPMNWTYNADMGIVPLDPQQPYQVYRMQNGAEDLTITVCAQYPDTDNPLVRPVHIGFNQMCTVPEPPVPPVPTWEVYLPLLQR
ncbi:MAG: hypothetical protein ACOCXQ_04485 [Patescibacteria group bacterium]